MAYAKLIWDFMGEEGQRTAAHFKIHLEEFLQREVIPFYKIAEETAIPNSHYLIYTIVDMTYVDRLRAALKPHRGKKVEQLEA